MRSPRRRLAPERPRGRSTTSSPVTVQSPGATPETTLVMVRLPIPPGRCSIRSSAVKVSRPSGLPSPCQRPRIRTVAEVAPAGSPSGTQNVTARTSRWASASAFDNPPPDGRSALAAGAERGVGARFAGRRWCCGGLTALLQRSVPADGSVGARSLSSATATAGRWPTTSCRRTAANATRGYGVFEAGGTGGSVAACLVARAVFTGPDYRSYDTLS